MNVQYTKLAVSVSTILFCLCLLAYAEDKTKGPAGVSVRLIGEADSLVLGDPAALTLVLRNNSGKSVFIVADGTACPVIPQMSFFVASANQEVFRRVELLSENSGVTKAMAPPEYANLIAIPSNGSTSFTFCVDYERRGLDELTWLFPAPGEYKIKVGVYFPEGDVSGDEIPYDAPLVEVETRAAVLKVVPSSSPEDKEAFLTIGKLAHGWRLYAPGACAENAADGEDIFRDIGQIRVSHAKSRFGAYAELCQLHASFVKALLGKNEKAMGDLRRRCEALEADKKWSPGWRYKARELGEKMDEYVKAIPRIQPADSTTTDETVPTFVVPKQALPAADRAAVERVVQSFGSFMLSGPEEKCLALLTDNFRYRETMTKGEFRKEIQESVKKAKDAETNGRLTVTPTLQEVGLNDQGAVALVIVDRTFEYKSPGRAVEGNLGIREEE